MHAITTLCVRVSEGVNACMFGRVYVFACLLASKYGRGHHTTHFCISYSQYLQKGREHKLVRKK